MGKTADLRKDGWPPDEMQKYNPWQAAERYTEDPNAVARRGRAMEISREAARILKKKYGATRVVLFGSLARSSLFAPDSGRLRSRWTCRRGGFFGRISFVARLGGLRELSR